MPRSQVILYALGVLALAFHGAFSTELSLLNDYPQAGNFNRVSLNCSDSMAVFMRNESEPVSEVMAGASGGQGSMEFVLTPESEGHFYCTANGSRSNRMGLAAQPVSVNDTTVLDVALSGNEEVKTVNLQCGVQPGALSESYHPQWKKTTSGSDSDFTLSSTAFNITVKARARPSEVTYRCEVKIDHDATHSRTYSGGNFMIRTYVDHSTRMKITIAACSIVSAVLVTSIVAIVILIAWQNRVRTKSRRLTKFSTAPSKRTSSKESREKCKASGHRAVNQEENIRQTSDFQCEIYDDDNDDADSARVVSSTCVSDDISFSPNTCVQVDESSPSTRFKYIFETKVQNDPSSFLPSPLESSSPPYYGSADVRTTKFLGIGSQLDSLSSECLNPHCQCHDVRVQKMFSNIPELKASSTENNGAADISESLRVTFCTTYTLRNCTEKGLIHTDRDYGFHLDIPQGAIPSTMTLTIDVGIALSGPFSYPRNSKRVSPVVWLCVRGFDNFKFLKPVTVSLQHCLAIDDTDTLDSLGLRFLKAGHSPDSAGNYRFQPSDGYVDLSSNSNYLTLSTDHFCYLCVVSNIQPSTLSRVQYCLSPFYPQHITQENNKIHFYVSFLLETCLKTIEKQCEKGLKKLTPKPFLFGKEKCLKIDFSEPHHWILPLECNEEIHSEDVDFDKDDEELRTLVEHGMYPPRFTVGSSPQPGAQSTKVHFTFSGGRKKIGMDILLQLGAQEARCGGHLLQTPEHCSTPSPSPEPLQASPCSRNDDDRVLSLRLNDFMEYVASKIRTKWRFFGIMVDIPADVLDSFPLHDALQCFARVFDCWVRRGSPPANWETVVAVLESETLEETKLAHDLRKSFLPSLVALPSLARLPQLCRGGSSQSTYSDQTRQSSADTGYESAKSSEHIMVSDV